MDRKLVAVRLTAAGRARLRRLADHYGLSQAAVIELAVQVLETALDGDAAEAAFTRWIKEQEEQGE